MGDVLEIGNLITASTTLGYQILSHGAETYRVEECISRICKAYGYRNTDVFVIPSSIVVTISGEDDEFITKTKRVILRDTDLDKVDKLNDLCRSICRDKPDYEYIMQELDRIERRPVYSGWVQHISYGIISAFFTLFYGGNLGDATAAFFIGTMLRALLGQMGKLGATSFFLNIIGGAFSALMCDIAVSLGFAQNMDTMVIGILMNLVPGIALTNAMREFIAADLISGMIKLVEALIVAVGIAIGVMLSLAYLAPLAEVLL